MDDVVVTEEMEREIADLMTDFGFEREVAMTVLELVSPPEAFGDGDLVCLHPLTDEQRRRLGLGRDPDEVMAEQRARQAREAAEAADSADGRDVGDGTVAAEDRGAGPGRAAGRRAARSQTTGGHR
jgi:hypothetical protein